MSLNMYVDKEMLDKCAIPQGKRQTETKTEVERKCEVERDARPSLSVFCG